MQVPFLDLKAHHQPYREEFSRAIEKVIDSGAFLEGEVIEKFEQEFAEFCGTRFSIAVGSGTDALWLALVALGVGPGDEVITVPNTFIATVEAILMAGAVPVFVDIDEQTCNIDPTLIASAITPRTKAIIPVHLFGQPADMDPILKIGRSHGIRVIEDAAQAHGARYGDRKAGALGDAGCFSFYPGKNLGAFGDAGAVVTSDIALYQKIKTLRNHGQDGKNHHTVVGWNCRMDALQAAVLSCKLTRLESMNRCRMALAEQYDQLLINGCHSCRCPSRPANTVSSNHLYVIRVEDRSGLIIFLESKGVGTGLHYPVPIHLQPGYFHLGYSAGSFPISEKVAGELVSLPLYPEMTLGQVRFVAESIIQYYDQTNTRKSATETSLCEKDRIASGKS